MQTLQKLLEPKSLPVDETTLTKLILDPSHYIDADQLEPHEEIAREICYALHHERATLMGNPPPKPNRQQNVLSINTH